MRELMRRFRERRASDDQSGFTLVELLVVMSIFMGLLIIVFGIMITMSRQTKDNLARTEATEQVRIGLMQIDRQVRSGNVISDPAAETVTMSGADTYYSLRVYTQTDGVFQCVQWRVVYEAASPFGRLEYRSWKPSWQSTGGVESWRTVARDIVRPASDVVDEDDPTTWPPFFVESSDAENASNAQTIRVTLRVKDEDQSEQSRPAVVTSTLTGRNTIFGYPADTCSPVPAP
ncbi:MULTISPECIES: PilW family protein [Cellulomonas]|uniref:Prepilin-type cleavage/methylation-like protein n=1 Tax=Cellulomonas gilvus (strain ATCC 13127 / NRRL B-14078) TaxID=593907 RepID=F8A6V8_CELGA|nr:MULTISPECIES: type II secretion system protein [Cellulomonas]AEI12312.1 prepilin-type cleavage/methylation-like protein [Cellulomonas gilvus ATCC 13127]MCR6689922.1 type II secretion system GspH family protein [Cellulomonas sp.]